MLYQMWPQLFLNNSTIYITYPRPESQPVIRMTLRGETFSWRAPRPSKRDIARRSMMYKFPEFYWYYYVVCASYIIQLEMDGLADRKTGSRITSSLSCRKAFELGDCKNNTSDLFKTFFFSFVFCFVFCFGSSFRTVRRVGVINGRLTHILDEDGKWNSTPSKHFQSRDKCWRIHA